MNAKKILCALLLVSMMFLSCAVAEDEAPFGWSTDYNFDGMNIESETAFTWQHDDTEASYKINEASRVWKTLLDGTSTFSLRFVSQCDAMSSPWVRVMGVELELNCSGGNGNQAYVNLDHTSYDWYNGKDNVFTVTITRENGGDITFTVSGKDNETPLVMTHAPIEVRREIEFGTYRGMIAISDIEVSSVPEVELPAQEEVVETPAAEKTALHGWDTDYNFDGMDIQSETAFTWQHDDTEASYKINEASRVWKDLLPNTADFSITFESTCDAMSSPWVRVMGVELELNCSGGNGNQAYVNLNRKSYDWYNGTANTFTVTVQRVAGGDITFIVSGADNPTPLVMTCAPVDETGIVEFGTYRGMISITNLTVESLPVSGKDSASEEIVYTPPVASANREVIIPDLSGRTITILTNDTWLSGFSLSDVLPRFKQIEEKTGCKIVWETTPGGGDYETLVQTRLAGDPSDCPDLIQVGTSTGTFSSYIDEGLLYDVTKAYDVCPNIKAFWEECRTDLKGSFTHPDGGIYNLLADVYLYPGDQAANVAAQGDNALWYRADIAKQLGFDAYPKTIDELHELLLAVKTTYPDMVPMHMWNWNDWESARIFTSAYGLHFNNESAHSYFYADENGVVQFEPALQATKAWLTEMHKWYEEGLIVVSASEEAKIGAAAQGKVFSGFYADVTALCEASLKQINPDAYFLYMPFPSVDGYETTVMPRNAYSNSFITIDNGDESQCRAVLQFLDYAFFSDYGIYSEKAGVEGEGWSFGENGEFVPNEHYVASILKKEVVLEASGADTHFLMPSVSTYEVNSLWHDAQEKVRAELGIPEIMTEEQKANWLEINAINSAHYKTPFPVMYMSEEDQERLNAISSDLYTFTEENMLKYILGTRKLDDFDKRFVAPLYDSLKLQEILDMYQKYFDEYLANAGLM